MACARTTGPRRAAAGAKRRSASRTPSEVVADANAAVDVDDVVPRGADDVHDERHLDEHVDGDLLEVEQEPHRDARAEVEFVPLDPFAPADEHAPADADVERQGERLRL